MEKEKMDSVLLFSDNQKDSDNDTNSSNASIVTGTNKPATTFSFKLPVNRDQSLGSNVATKSLFNKNQSRDLDESGTGETDVGSSKNYLTAMRKSPTEMQMETDDAAEPDLNRAPPQDLVLFTELVCRRLMKFDENERIEIMRELDEVVYKKIQSKKTKSKDEGKSSERHQMSSKGKRLWMRKKKM